MNEEVVRPNKVSNIFKRVYQVIIWIIVAILFTLIIAFGYSAFIKKDKVPNIFGYSFLTIATGSMSDALEIGDMIIIKDTADYKVNDIITFLPDGASVTTTHRIVRIEGDKIYTKGDANDSEDGYIYSNQIVGEVVHVIPKFGLFVEWTKTPTGITFVVLTFLLIGFAVYVIKKQ